MSAAQQLIHKLDQFPRVYAAHTPTPIDRLDNLGADLGLRLSVKRDDCTGIAFGGNKVRQLEFYLGEAVAMQADTLLITGAVQSNFVRTAAAMAAKYNLACHVQLEERVDTSSEQYRSGGNVLLNRLLGATVHSYAAGEDESGADKSLDNIADQLREEGGNPYVVHLGMAHPPTGALGYVAAAAEFASQITDIEEVDEIFIGSGSALTHTGLLYGLRVLGINTPVTGVCVRRPHAAQLERVTQRLHEVSEMLGAEVDASEIQLTDGTLAPGYGVMSDHTRSVIQQTAGREGLIVDPAYTGKVMAAVFKEAPRLQGKHVLMWHTGGQPAVFAYQDKLGYQAAQGDTLKGNT